MSDDTKSIAEKRKLMAGKTKWWQRGFAVLLSATLAGGCFGAAVPEQKQEVHAAVKQDVATIKIDGSTVNKKKQNRFRGLGAVSCNNSSRLLMDYKEDHPKEYWEIMRWLFDKKNGAGLSHIKIELGCDLDTSSGAEPATKRSPDAKANVRRGAGFMFAHDALTINKDISVDLLCWSMPAWVQQAYDRSKKAGFKARYRWYKQTIDAAHKTWGIKVSYLGANQNEKPVETGWTVYLADRLAKEKKQRYDYGKIKIVAADETDTMDVADKMLKNKKYRKAVDVIGCHYNSYMNGKVKKLNKKYKKEVWFSEGASVATDSIFGANNTDNGVSTSGTNGMLDVANRIIIGYAQSNMTMYEFQPAVASYYDGAVYYPKQLLSANDPWSGYYKISNGLVMAMHFTNFIKKGWSPVDSGSYGDGIQSDHYISDTKDDYLTETDTGTGDYSTVITNDSSVPRTYHFKVSKLKKASAKVAVWETRSNAAGEAYDAGWLNKVNEITPKRSGSRYTYTVTVKPYSMVTVTTTTGQKSYAERKKMTGAGTVKDTVMALPYTDDFEYKGSWLKKRGGTPKYTCDVNGAFEVVKLSNGNRVLQQKINPDRIPFGWSGEAVNPVTSLGDDTWKDYVVSVDVMLDPDENGNNYASLCARYNSSESVSENGYWLKIKRDGNWTLTSNKGRQAKGRISGMKEGRFVNLKLKVQGNRVTAYINHKKVAEKTASSSVANSGRVALGSAFYKNCFDNLQVKPIAGGVDSVSRVDSLDTSIRYSSDVKRQQSLSYVNYGRTLSRMEKKGASMSYTFTGTGISILGSNNAGPKIQVVLDGKVVKNNYAIADSANRSAFYQVTGLANRTHTVSLRLLNNEPMDIDALEVDGAKNTLSHVKATGVSIKTAKKTLAYGQYLPMQVTTVPAAAKEDVTYTTSNMSVAVVTSDGRIYGNGGGKAVITATTSSGAKSSVTVTVTELRITPGSGIRVGAGEKVSLSAAFAKKSHFSKIKSWKSSNRSVASVNSKGKVKTKRAGYVIITATAKNGYRGKAVIHVRRAPSKVKITRKKLTLKKGKKKQLRYKLPAGSYCTKAVWSSDNKKIAYVTNGGVVKAKGKGTCKIRVKTYNGKKSTIQITVK